MGIKATPQLKAAVANMDSTSKAQYSRLSDILLQATKKKSSGNADASDLPGAIAPLNFWDPAGFSTDIDKDKLLFYREAEIKHGRVCMSASLGLLVAERYHPLFGGDIDVPSVFMPLETNLRSFWIALAVVIGAEEGLEPGDVGYDPLGLLPSDPEELETIQNKEILNGRFAMISLAGMVAEELVTKEKLHGLPF